MLSTQNVLKPMLQLSLGEGHLCIYAENEGHGAQNSQIPLIKYGNQLLAEVGRMRANCSFGFQLQS